MASVINTAKQEGPVYQVIDSLDRKIIKAVQKGIPLVKRPYQHLAVQTGIDEETFRSRIQNLVETGIFKRFGVVLRHHELGYRANGMVVWNIPDEAVHNFTSKIIQFPFVTLCYQRSRKLPAWPYNIFSMIHGKNRDEVLENISDVIEYLDFDHINYKVLFSKRRFKQHGAIYFNDFVCDPMYERPATHLTEVI